MWGDVEARVVENDSKQANAVRQEFLGIIRDSGLLPNGGATKYMVGFAYGDETTVVWELTGQAQNFFVASNWRDAIERAGFRYEEKHFINGLKDGGRHSGLNRNWSFPGANCLCLKIKAPDDLRGLLAALDVGVGEPAAEFSRSRIEAAMDAFDRYRLSGENEAFFGHFNDPREFWVRSTREREARVYPTKPVVAHVRKATDLNGGWSTRHSAAAYLHNAGFIIVDRDDKPFTPPVDQDHLVQGAERIRLCALNYFIEPAREQGASEVAICAGDLAAAMGLKEAFPNVCQALGGNKFQRLACVPPPVYTDPNPSSSTIFSYKLKSQTDANTVIKETTTPALSATNLILYGPPRHGQDLPNRMGGGSALSRRTGGGGVEGR